MTELGINKVDFKDSIMYLQFGGRYVNTTVSSYVTITSKSKLPTELITIGFKKQITHIMSTSINQYMNLLNDKTVDVVDDKRSYNDIFIDILTEKLKQINVLSGEFIFTVKIGNLNIKTDYLDGVSPLEQKIIINYI